MVFFLEICYVIMLNCLFPMLSSDVWCVPMPPVYIELCCVSTLVALVTSSLWEVCVWRLASLADRWRLLLAHRAFHCFLMSPFLTQWNRNMNRPCRFIQITTTTCNRHRNTEIIRDNCDYSE